MCPSSQYILAIHPRRAWTKLFNCAGIKIPLECYRVPVFGQPIHAKPTLPHSPVVLRVLAIRKNSAVPIEIFSIQPEINIFSNLVAVTCPHEIPEQTAPSTHE